MIAQQIKPLAVGDKLDSITLLDHDNNPLDLSLLKGKKLVIYFYPKNNTPQCTKQACSIRDTYDQFQKNNIQVIGINYQSPADHRSFKKRYNVPFMLLSDPRGDAAKRLGAYRGVTRWFFPARTTILVNEEGTITHIMRTVDVATHVPTILNNFGIS
jgi:peroxiredoxin Q/BCP